MDSWIERLGSGQPKIGYQVIDGATAITYRDPEGRVVAGAVLNADNSATDLMFTDQRRGALGARGAVAVARELQRRGVMESSGEISPEALRFRVRMENEGRAEQPVPRARTPEELAERGIPAPERSQEATTRAEPASATSQEAVTPQKAVTEASPEDLVLEPERFQYKINRDAVGATGSLSGVQEWNPDLAGVVSVWRDPADNRLRVVNGHNRVAKARQLGVESLRVMEIDAPTAEEARSIGAMQNIADGKGTEIDAAKFLRESSVAELESASRQLPLSEAKVDQGLGLAGLSDFLFNQVVSGDLAVGRGAIIGRHLKGNDDLQAQLYKEIAKRERRSRVTNEMVEDIARRMESSGTVTEESNQGSLFGDSGATERSLAFEEAEIAADVRSRLRKAKSAFGNAARNAPLLEEAGNQIDAEMSRGLSEEAAVNLAVFEKLRSRTEIAGIINEAARDLAAGEGSTDAIKKRAFDSIRSSVAAALGNAASPSRSGVRETEEAGSGRDGEVEPEPLSEADEATRQRSELEEQGQGGLFGSPAPDEDVEAPPQERLAAKRPRTREEQRNRHEAPRWMRKGPETKAGKKLVEAIRKDEEGRAAGTRTVGDFLVKATNAELRVGREQSTATKPAHYQPSAHLIRSRAGNNIDYVAHEIGHALSAILRDKNPKVFRGLKSKLTAFVGLPGSLASAKSPEEGFAEWVRHFVTDPAMLSEVGEIDGAIAQAVEAVAPESMAALRDAARAFDVHMGRELFSRFRSHSRTRPTPKETGSQIRDAWHRVLFLAVARRSAIHRMNRNVWRAARQAAKRGAMDRRAAYDSVRRFLSRVKDTDADLSTAYQSVLHATQEVAAAFLGRGRSERQGLRIRKTGEGSKLDPEMVAVLREAGLPIPDGASVRHGDWIYLTDKSVQDIVEGIGDGWADFETYAQARVALDRYNKKGHEYPGFPHDPSPGELESLVADGDARPGFREAFADFQEYADGLLSIGVLGGMVKPSAAARMKEAYEDYLPLIREQERELGFSGAGTMAHPTGGFKRAFGGQQPFLPLREALELRTNQVLGAYYANRAVMAPIRAAEMAAEDMSLPKDVRDVVGRVATKLALDREVVAKLTPDEARKVIAEYLSEQSEETIDPDDIDVHWDAWNIWRAKEPAAIRVVAPVINGERVFYQVEDQILYDLFAHTSGEGGKVSEIFDLFARWATGMTAPWKRALTQNIVFAARNIWRDTTTGNFFGEDVKSFVLGFYSLGGMIRQLTGRVPEGSSAAELLSRTSEATHSPAHRVRIGKFRQILTEGVIPDNWRRMSMAEKIAELAGPIPMAVAMKPVELALWATGQRYIAQLTEEASRIQAYATTLDRGGSHEAAQEAYDYVTGNFGDQPASHFVSQLYRIPGFVNPAVQITYEIGHRLSHPDPKVRAAHWIKAAPWLMTVTAIGWAMNRLMTPDDKEEELAEREDEDKLAYMVIGGFFRVPFDYGLLGAVQSWTWNTLDSMAGHGPRGKATARILLKRASDLPIGGPMSFMQPQIKALLENEANYQWYWADEIEPHWMKYLPPEDRAYWSTPKVYRAIARMTGVGPLKVQHFVQAGMSYQLDEAVRWVDRIERGERIEEPSDAPFIGRLFQRTPRGWASASVQRVAEMDEKYAAAKERLEALRDDPSSRREDRDAAKVHLRSLEAFHDGMSDLRKMHAEVKELRQTGKSAEARAKEEEMTAKAAEIVADAIGAERE